jgi:hypothetical protein
MAVTEAMAVRIDPIEKGRCLLDVGTDPLVRDGDKVRIHETCQSPEPVMVQLRLEPAVLLLATR